MIKAFAKFIAHRKSEESRIKNKINEIMSISGIFYLANSFDPGVVPILYIPPEVEPEPGLESDRDGVRRGVVLLLLFVFLCLLSVVVSF